MSYESFKKLSYLLIIFFLILLPYLGINVYNLHVYTLICIYIIIAIGLNIIFGHTGQISLGHAAFYAIGAYTSALLTVKLGFPFLLALLCAGAVNLIIGLGVGAATLKLEGSYLAMATIGLGEIVRMVLIHWEKITGGPAGITKIPDPSFWGWQIHSPQGKYYLVLFITILAFICYRNLMMSNYGSKFAAVKDNLLAAQAMGINATRTKVVAFGLSTLYAGIGGSLYAHLNCYVAPDAFPLSESITFVVIVVLGGMGSILGPIMGSVILIEFKESLRMLKDYNMLIYGFGLMALMIFAPKGFAALDISGVFRRLFRKNG